MTGGRGVHKNLTFADRGRGGGVKNGQKNADVINERPLKAVLGPAAGIKMISQNTWL